MHLTGEETIAAPREIVWAALHDADMLKASIPGCEHAEFKTEKRLVIAIKLSFGIFSRTFKGRVKLSEEVAPISLRASGEGKGGAAGESKWHARLTLDDVNGATRLRYDATAELDGKLAQMGAFVIEPAAKKVASRFLANLRQTLEDRRKTA